MKKIVIGTSLSGKTTLVKYIRENFKDIPVAEVDENLTTMNNYEYPTDNNYKHKVLVPQIVKDVLETESIMFFTNTDYFTSEDLRLAKQKGFEIITLDLNIDELQKRNNKRLKLEGYADMSEWLEGMVAYNNRIEEEGLVDKVIDASKATEQIAAELVK